MKKKPKFVELYVRGVKYRARWFPGRTPPLFGVEAYEWIAGQGFHEQRLRSPVRLLEIYEKLREIAAETP